MNTRGFEANTSDRNLVITLNKVFYEKAAIFQTAYRFTDRCRVDIRPGEKDVVIVSLSLKEGQGENAERLLTDFQNELVDQQLRLDLEKRYGRLREIIYEHAFSPISNLEERLKDVR